MTYAYIIICMLIYHARTVQTSSYYEVRDQWESALFGIDGRNVSTDCLRTLEAYQEELHRGNITWALRMLDSTTKIQSGIFYGNLKDFGSFDECLNIETVITIDNENRTIVGKHCFSSFTLKDIVKDETLIQGEAKLINLVWSICLPNLCSTDDLNKLFQELPLTFEDVHCQTKYDRPDFNVGDILASVFFGLLLFTCLASTLYDTYLHYTESDTEHVILTAFSALTNGRKLLKINNNSNQLNCLNGIRFISMMWIVAGHEYSLSAKKPIFNLGMIDEWIHNPKSMYMLGGYVAVDTFFLLSGLLVSFMYLTAAQKGIKFNIFQLYLHRYLRLTPPVVALIIVHLTLVKYFGSGPQWPEASETLFVGPCKRGWWEPLLYIQNYINVADACVPHSWYICCDMHLYLMSPVLLLALKKWPKSTLTAITFIAIGSVLWGFLLAWHNNWVGLMIGQDDPDGTSLRMQGDYYIKTHTRASPWLIGFMFGYLIFKHKSAKSPEIDKIVLLLLWITSLAILAICIYGGYFLTVRKQYSRFENAAYIAFLKPAWAVGLCWIIYACLFGYGGPINAFLSLPVFQIGSRFTYSIYVTHYSFLVISAASSRLPIYVDDYKLIHEFIGDFIVVFIISIFWTLLFESPIIVMEKVMFGNGKTAKNDQKPNMSADAVSANNVTAEIKISTD